MKETPPDHSKPISGAFPKELLSQIQTLIQRRYGLVIESWQTDFLISAIVDRMRTLNVHRHLDYLTRLKTDARGSGNECRALMNLVTNNETFFFRFPDQYDVIRTQLWPAAPAPGPGAPFRIWSAGCSTGEEIYSLVLSWLDLPSDRRLSDVEFWATDINERVLAAAKRGVYNERAIRLVPAGLKSRFFRSDPQRPGYHLAPEVRQQVRFGYFNLAESDEGNLSLPRFDLILCRNVLIYFDKDTAARVVNLLFEHLLDHGTLLLSPSESLWNITDRFALEFVQNQAVYRKRPVSEPHPTSTRTAPERPEHQGSSTKRAACSPRQTGLPGPVSTAFQRLPGLQREPEKKMDARTLCEQGFQALSRARTEEARHLFLQAEQSDRQCVPARLGLIQASMNRGELDDAEARCRAALEAHPMEGDLLYTHAILAIQRRDMDLAEKQLRAVIYLHPSHLMARFSLMHLLQDQGRGVEAQGEARTLRRIIRQGRGAGFAYPEAFETYSPESIMRDLASLLDR